MTTVEVSAEIAAPPQRVWNVTSDPRNLPHWDKHLVAVGLPEEGLGRGARYEVVMRFMAVRAKVRAEIVEWEPPWRSKIRLVGLLDATVTTSIASLPFERSLLRHEVSYRFRGPFGSLGAKSLAAVGGPQLALKRGLAAQKREIESG